MNPDTRIKLHYFADLRGALSVLLARRDELRPSANSEAEQSSEEMSMRLVKDEIASV